jgi:hypothetical protein
LVASLGRRLDRVNNDYRDKHIEHPSMILDDTVVVLVSDAGGVMRLHVHPITEDQRDAPTPSEVDPPFVVEDTPDHHLYHIHVAAVSGLDSFTDARGVTPIGVSWDGGTGHFEHWQEHTHRYFVPKPGRSDQVIAVDHVEGPVLSTSPRSFELTAELEHFLQVSFQAMNGIVSPDERTLTIDSRLLAAAQQETYTHRTE